METCDPVLPWEHLDLIKRPLKASALLLSTATVSRVVYGATAPRAVIRDPTEWSSRLDGKTELSSKCDLCPHSGAQRGVQSGTQHVPGSPGSPVPAASRVTGRPEEEVAVETDGLPSCEADDRTRGAAPGRGPGPGEDAPGQPGQTRPLSRLQGQRGGGASGGAGRAARLGKPQAVVLLPRGEEAAG